MRLRSPRRLSLRSSGYWSFWASSGRSRRPPAQTSRPSSNWALFPNFGAKCSPMCSGSNLRPSPLAPRVACLPHPSRGAWRAEPTPSGRRPGHSEHIGGYCTSQCGAQGGYCTSHPGARRAVRSRVLAGLGHRGGDRWGRATHRDDFLRHADRVLQLRDGTVNEWERRTTDALLH